LHILPLIKLLARLNFGGTWKNISKLWQCLLSQLNLALPRLPYPAWGSHDSYDFFKFYLYLLQIANIKNKITIVLL
jgi:hypothetical protein